jgi:catechol 2,3-dioxygenase-like lactoylglutathione lyase family enzyme
MNLNQVTIYSTNPTASIEFYQKLGLRLIVDSAPRYVRFECPDGDSTFSIHETGDDSVNSKIVLYFECENLDEEVKRLKELGLTFEQEPVDQTWLWREAFLRDPDGNKIILFSAGENRKNPPWRVK